ncbi:unnamed protein product [Darwinula stevensoni]|uniref:Uncharacterized protein n=1 Tax=Darwinula stevensoni TaxID=69355 RepID=A0A7R9A8J5_9CRUS|nr:unnamed protein product [Darwinula stevensoni]CAG0896504.1 unnamed protein product [Darwinula stevensoni]
MLPQKLAETEKLEQLKEEKEHLKEVQCMISGEQKEVRNDEYSHSSIVEEMGNQRENICMDINSERRDPLEDESKTNKKSFLEVSPVDSHTRKQKGLTPTKEEEEGEDKGDRDEYHRVQIMEENEKLQRKHSEMKDMEPKHPMISVLRETQAKLEEEARLGQADLEFQESYLADRFKFSPGRVKRKVRSTCRFYRFRLLKKTEKLAARKRLLEDASPSVVAPATDINVQD